MLHLLRIYKNTLPLVETFLFSFVSAASAQLHIVRKKTILNIKINLSQKNRIQISTVYSTFYTVSIMQRFLFELSFFLIK
jgi:hypothetical protein